MTFPLRSAVSSLAAAGLCLALGYGEFAAPAPAGAAPREAGPPPGLYWIQWGPGWEDLAAKAAAGGERIISPRAEARLRKAGVVTSSLNPGSLPAPRAFLDHLHDLGIEVRVASRCLRAASARLTAEDLARLAADPGIAAIAPVFTLQWRTRDQGSPGADGGGVPAPWRDGSATAGGDRDMASPAGEAAPLDTLPDPRDLTRLDYGASWDQSDELAVPALHLRGYSGRGVLVCMLDGGFFPGHEAFAHTRVIATRDFVEHDRSVGYDPTRPGAPYNTPAMNYHGTSTFSALGGFSAGRLIGPAYRAEFALGRTEVIETETRMEEDTYVAGLEWADSLGADVVSTSLGYLNFPDNIPYFSYGPADLDGRTAKTSRAAAWLARRGVVLVTAMGNGGPQPRSLVTPADAESVVSVGAVDPEGAVAAFSSRGPNARGVTKPDVCARGLLTACADASSPDAYGTANGTSLATPLVAGLVALLLEAHPQWTPWQVQEALHRAGDQATVPDDDRGWGVPDGLAALEAFDPPVRRAWPYPNPLVGTGELTLELDQTENGPVSLTALDASGRVVSRPITAAPMPARARLHWTPGAELPSGVYFLRIETGSRVLGGRFVLLR